MFRKKPHTVKAESSQYFSFMERSLTQLCVQSIITGKNHA